MVGATADMRNYVRTGGPKMSQQRYVLINQQEESARERALCQLTECF